MRLSWRRITAFAVGLFAVFALLACGTETQFKVLSFFFDGVPPPPGHASLNAVGDGQTSPTLQANLAAGRKAPRSSPTPMPIVSTHPATEGEKNCRTCHDPTRGLKALDQEAKICEQCHADLRKQGKWNHGPINLGHCLPCHRAHGSPYPHLLDKPIPDLCLHCHSVNEPGEKMKHDFKNMTPELARCLACHNPHKVN